MKTKLNLSQRLQIALYVLINGDLPFEPAPAPAPAKAPKPADERFKSAGPAPGSKASPHMLNTEPHRFSSNYLTEQRNECLEIAQAWRQNNLDGRFEWVLIHVKPADWNRLKLCNDKRGPDAFEQDSRIIYRLMASQQQELNDWAREVSQ